MSLLSIQFDVDVLAQSSIVHREDYSAVGTDNWLFRKWSAGEGGGYPRREVVSVS